MELINLLIKFLGQLLSLLWTVIIWFWHFYVTLPVIKSMSPTLQLLIFIIFVGGVIFSVYREVFHHHH